LNGSLPLTIGIAVYNMIFVEGVIRIAANHDVAMTAPTAMKVQVLSAGLNLAFFGSLVIGLVTLVLTFITHEEIHPYNRDRPAGDEPPSGMLWKGRGGRTRAVDEWTCTQRYRHGVDQPSTYGDGGGVTGESGTASGRRTAISDVNGLPILSW